MTDNRVKEGLFILLYLLGTGVLLARYYTNGCLVLGGEGDFVLDWSVYLKRYGFAWHPVTYGLGSINFAPMGIGANTLFLWAMERFVGSAAYVNFALIYAIYTAPFLAMFYLCRVLKAPIALSFTMALFYVINPFVSYYLTNLNQWNVFSVSAMPLFLAVVLRWRSNLFLLFFVYGIVTSLFSFAYTNIPMFVVIQIALVLMLGIFTLSEKGFGGIRDLIKQYLTLGVSFVLFHMWWIPAFLIAMQSSQQIYTKSFADTWLQVTVKGAFPILTRMFTLTVMIPQDKSFDFYAFWYNGFLPGIITMIPFCIAAIFVFMGSGSKAKNKLEIRLLWGLLASLFFVKGTAGFGGFFYLFLYKHLPFFYMFKTPVEKFGLLYIFIFAVLLTVVLVNRRGRPFERLAMRLFWGYLVFCSVPWFAGHIIPDYKTANNYVSRKFFDNAAYMSARAYFNDDARHFRVISFPGTGNYQVCLPTVEGKYYAGIDPVISNIDKPCLTSYSGLGLADIIFDHMTLVKYEKLLSIFHIKMILLNDDLSPWFGFRGEIGDAADIKAVLGKRMPSRAWGPLTCYENPEFLPYLYAAR